MVFLGLRHKGELTIISSFQGHGEDQLQGKSVCALCKCQGCHVALREVSGGPVRMGGGQLEETLMSDVYLCVGRGPGLRQWKEFAHFIRQGTGTLDEGTHM